MDMMLEEFKTIFDRPEKVKKLREVILDLAVRGKLVEQNPEDEPASILLERIKEEKERLIKEKKIKKEKDLPEISCEEIMSNLPKGWKWTRLGNLVSIFGRIGFRGYTKRDMVAKGKGAITISPSNISSAGKTDFKNCSYISWEKYNESPEIMIFNGDLILVKTGSSYGKCAIVQDLNEKATLNPQLVVLKYILCNKIYINYILKSPYIRNKLDELVIGTSIPTLSQSKLANLIIPLPPLSEQKRIVKKIDSLMAFCDKLEESLEKKVHYGELAAKSVFNLVGNVSSSEELEEMLLFIIKNFKDISLGDNAVKELKNCILQLAVQGKLVEQNPNDEPAEVLLERIREEKERLVKEKKIKKEKALPEISEEEKPFELPMGWSFIRLNSITKKIGAGSTPRGGKSVYLDNGIKFIRSQNVYNSGLLINDVVYISKEIHEKMLGSEVKPRDLLMNITGASIGRCCIVPSDFDTGNVNQHVTIIRLINSQLTKYIHLVLTSPYIFNTIMKMQVGISREGLSVSKLSGFIIPIPPLEEQKRIVQKVDSLMLLCDELEKKIEEQKEYSNKLMESAIKEMLQSISNKEELVSKEIEKEDEILVTIS